MKKIINILTISAISISSLFAQLKEKREINGFTEITTSGFIEVELIQGDEYSVEIEAPEGKLEKIKTDLSGNTLSISTPGNWSKENPKAYITIPKIEMIKASGSSEIYSKGLLQGDKLTVVVSGACEVKLSVKTTKINVTASGASELKLRGYTEEQILVASGASDVDAEELVTLKSIVTISGASDVDIHATESINGTVSGASDLGITGNPTTNNIKKSGVSSVDGLGNSNNEYNSDVEITNDIVGDVIVQEHGDTTRISIGKKKILIIDDWNKTSVDLDLADSNTDKSNSDTWTYGIDGMIVGVNSFLNSSNQLETPAEYEFLETDIARSHNFQITFLDGNLPLIKGNCDKNESSIVSLHPGLGLEFNSYEFRKDYWLNESSSKNTEISANQAIKSDSTSLSFDKNRLKDTYLNVPLMLAFHTNKDHKKAMHIGVGGYAGLRLASKMKYKYKLDGEGTKLKVKDDYYLSPFRYGLTASIGYSNINVFANYALNGLFEENKGPELHPFSVGLMIVGF